MRDHISRSWAIKDPFVDECPCEKAPCGAAIPAEGCDQHWWTACRTIRNGHSEKDCPGHAD